jgi:hypothetical protein
MRIIRASELVTYAYCQRAWWYLTKGIPSANAGWLDAGKMTHERHAREVVILGLLRWAGYGLILCGMAVAAAVLTSRWLG